MPRRLLAIFAMVAWLFAAVPATPALADTCCANRSVTFAPAAVIQGDMVEVRGIVCLSYDNSGPLPLNLVSWWLSTDHVPADRDPGTAPGDPRVHPAGDLPAADAWLPFDSVAGAGKAAPGTATLRVPEQLRDGTFQLWWQCDNGGGPGSGMHYAGSPRLRVGTAPDTATAVIERPGTPAREAQLVVIAAMATIGGWLGARRAMRPHR